MPAESNRKKYIYNTINERMGGFSFVFWLVAFLALVGIDQVTKYLAFHSTFGSFLNVLKPVIRKFHYFNHNFAFSLPLPPILMYALYLIILTAILWYLWKNYFQLNKLAMLAWVMIIAGAISNIGERMILGYVRDFVYVLSGIFNLADGFIIFGVLILMLQSFQKKNDHRNIKIESGIMD